MAPKRKKEQENLPTIKNKIAFILYIEKLKKSKEVILVDIEKVADQVTRLEEKAKKQGISTTFLAIGFLVLSIIQYVVLNRVYGDINKITEILRKIVILIQ